MRVIAKKALVSFYTKHEDAKTALEEWYKKTCASEWNNFSDVRETFNSADWVGNQRIVFNIRGNTYRLVALILFSTKMVYIRFVGTHEEYEAITNIDQI